MPQRLFNTGKIGAFVDTYSPGVEKRRGETASVLTVKFRVQPFDAKLASALDAGVGGDSNIRPTVFTLTGNADPKPNFTRHDLAIESFANPFRQFSRRAAIGSAAWNSSHAFSRGTISSAICCGLFS